MKTKILSFFVFALFLACNNDDDGTKPVMENTFTSLKNDQTWSGITEIGITADDTLVFLGVADGGADNGAVVAKVKFKGKGSYMLKGNQGIYYETVGQDAMISQYAIEPAKTGSFDITSYDEVNGRVEGNFELPLKATYLNKTNTTDSILKIVNGIFSGTIREETIH